MKTADIVKNTFMSFPKTDQDYSKKLHEKKSRKQLKDKITRQIKARINICIRNIIESKE